MDDEKTLDDSVKNDELDGEKTSDEKTGDAADNADDNAKSEADKSEKTETKTEADDEKIPDYRPKKPETKQENQEKPEHVPFNKFLSEKKRRQEAERKLKELQSGKEKDNKQAAEDQEEEVDDLDSRVERKVKEVVSPLLEKQQHGENLKNFEKDFERNVASKYPELKGQKDQFMEIAFNPSLVDKYPTLEDIRKAFWPDAKPTNVKKTGTEKGSEGASKGSETIDFEKLSEKPELYQKVMRDPELKKKYFNYLDSRGL